MNFIESKIIRAMKCILAGVLCLLLPLFLFPTPGCSQFLDQECGYHNMESSCIIRRTVKTREPWMALITKEGGDFVCAGTLISHRLVLTAAHCLRSNVKLNVTLGEYKRPHASSPGEVHEVASTFKHQKYNERTFANDIAILQLASYVEYKDHITPICILGNASWRERIYNREMLIATGWSITEKALDSREPKSQDIYREHPDLCRFNNYRKEPLASDQFCSRYRDRSLCNGSSGGPADTLAWIGDSLRHIQVGIASISSWGCERTTIFTDVLSHIDFILRVWHSHGGDRESRNRTQGES